MNTRIFVLNDDARVVSLGVVDTNSPTLKEDIINAAAERGVPQGGSLLTDIELYRLIETGREALNTP